VWAHAFNRRDDATEFCVAERYPVISESARKAEAQDSSVQTILPPSRQLAPRALENRHESSLLK
jgi:hypothetical protein